MATVRLTKKGLVILIILGLLIVGGGSGYLIWRLNQVENLGNEESSAGGNCSADADDGYCNEGAGESAANCDDCPPVCGDGACTHEESCGTCSKDCGVCAYCGDGLCNGGEICMDTDDEDGNIDECEDCGSCDVRVGNCSLSTVCNDKGCSTVCNDKGCCRAEFSDNFSCAGIAMDNPGVQYMAYCGSNNTATCMADSGFINACDCSVPDPNVDGLQNGLCSGCNNPWAYYKPIPDAVCNETCYEPVSDQNGLMCCDACLPPVDKVGVWRNPDCRDETDCDCGVVANSCETGYVDTGWSQTTYYPGDTVKISGWAADADGLGAFTLVIDTVVQNNIPFVLKNHTESCQLRPDICDAATNPVYYQYAQVWEYTYKLGPLTTPGDHTVSVSWVDALGNAGANCTGSKTLKVGQPVCNQTCASAGATCGDGSTCQSVGGTLTCVNPTCPTESDCICPNTPAVECTAKTVYRNDPANTAGIYYANVPITENDVVTPGEILLFCVNYKNIGDVALEPGFTDVIPAGLTLLDYQEYYCDYNAGTLSCTDQIKDPGKTGILCFRATVNENATASITNSATVTPTDGIKDICAVTVNLKGTTPGTGLFDSTASKIALGVMLILIGGVYLSFDKYTAIVKGRMITKSREKFEKGIIK